AWDSTADKDAGATAAAEPSDTAEASAEAEAVRVAKAAEATREHAPVDRLDLLAEQALRFRVAPDHALVGIMHATHGEQLDDLLHTDLVEVGILARLHQHRERHGGQALEDLRDVVAAVRPQLGAAAEPLVQVDDKVIRFGLGHLELFEAADVK